MSLHVIAIVGPTASGKTRLGVEVAHRLGSEIVSADSRQVYRGLDIGTGKDLDEYAAVSPPVPYHLIDVADPEEVYSLFRFQQDCYRVLRELAELRLRFPADQAIEKPAEVVNLVLLPDVLELWIGDATDRMHDRRRYTRKGDDWLEEILVP